MDLQKTRDDIIYIINAESPTSHPAQGAESTNQTKKSRDSLCFIVASGLLSREKKKPSKKTCGGNNRRSGEARAFREHRNT